MIRWPANPTKVEQNSTLVLPYSISAAAQAVIERLEERVVSESLVGNYRFVMSAEVVEEDGVYDIVTHLLYPNGGSSRPDHSGHRVNQLAIFLTNRRPKA
jgi:hypothetical protein